MKDTFEFTLNNPLTEEDWDMISDVDFDRTDRITFHTKHGKEVEFTKVIQCKDCKHRYMDRGMGFCEKLDNMFYLFNDSEPIDADFYCKWAERREG